MEPGTTVTLNLDYMRIIAKESEYRGPVVSFIQNKDGINEIIVQLSQSNGHSYRYFTRIEQPLFNDAGNIVEIKTKNKIIEARS